MTERLPTGAEEITWDLSDLYAGMDDPQLNADLDTCDAEADALGEEYRGRIAGLSSGELAVLISRYEALYRARLQGRLVRVTELDAGHAGPRPRRADATRHRARLPPEPENGLPGSGAGRRAGRGRRSLVGRSGTDAGGATGWRSSACTGPTCSASRRKRSWPRSPSPAATRGIASSTRRRALRASTSTASSSPVTRC